MDIGALSSAPGASRLLEALERMRTPPGEGLVSSGPSPVPRELSREFEQLMEQEPEGFQAHESVSAPDAVNQGEFFRTEDKSLQVDTVGDRPVDHTPNVEQIFTPEQLYQVQFAAGMLRIQVESVSKISQQASQGFDSLLRTQS